jgi:hypothetical protein
MVKQTLNLNPNIKRLRFTILERHVSECRISIISIDNNSRKHPKIAVKSIVSWTIAEERPLFTKLRDSLSQNLGRFHKNRLNSILRKFVRNPNKPYFFEILEFKRIIFVDEYYPLRNLRHYLTANIKSIMETIQNEHNN